MGTQTKKNNPHYFLYDVVGKTHRWWIEKPKDVFIVLLAYTLLVNITARCLLIWYDFFNPYWEICAGFGSGNWGMLLPFALPLAFVLVCWFLRLFSKAISSLDEIIEPKMKGDAPYSKYLSDRLKDGWWLFFLCLLSLITGVILFTDGWDIATPLTGAPGGHEADWSNYGYMLYEINPLRKPDYHPIFEIFPPESFKAVFDWPPALLRAIYFIFNVAVFLMEGLLGYWGFLLLFGTLLVNFTIIKDLSKLESARQNPPTSATGIAARFDLKWDQDGLNSRGGLHRFDKAFAVYSVLLVIALILVSFSVKNQDVSGQLDAGGWVAAISSLFFFINTLIWLSWPYWCSFPEKKSNGDEIKKAPFGTKNFFWIFVSTLGTIWVGIFYIHFMELGFPSLSAKDILKNPSSLGLPSNILEALNAKSSKASTVLNSLGGNAGQGKSADGKAIEQALAGYLKASGSGNPQAAMIWNTLADALKAKRGYDKTIEYFDNTPPGFLETLSPDDPKTAVMWSMLADALKSKSKYDKAVEYFEKVLSSDFKPFGSRSSDAATIWNVLADALKAKREYDKAIESLETLSRDIKMLGSLETFGSKYPQVAITLDGLASALKAKSKYDKIIEYFEKALPSDLTTLGFRPPDAATILNILGESWKQEGDYDKAIEYFELARDSDAKTFGPDHPRVAVRWSILGRAWEDKDKDKDKEATKCYEKALTIDLNTFGPRHLYVSIRWNKLGRIWKTKGDNAKAKDDKVKAKEYYRKARGYYEKALEVLETLGVPEGISLDYRTQLVEKNIRSLPSV